MELSCTKCGGGHTNMVAINNNTKSVKTYCNDCEHSWWTNPVTSSDEYTFPYLISEKEHQIQKMMKLGINTEAQTFEQCVNTLIHNQEEMYTEEEVEQLCFDIWSDTFNPSKEFPTFYKWFQHNKKK